MAGATQRRVEASLHRYWLSLATGRSRDWWNVIVPDAIRAEAARPRRGGRTSNPEILIRRLPFERFIELFDGTFPQQLSGVVGPTSRQQQHVLEVLITARDSAGHPGRPYLAVEARMAAAVAWDLFERIPAEFHDPGDVRSWLAGQAMSEHEDFVADDWDVCGDSPLTPEFLSDAHRTVADFKRIRTSGDGGFSAAIEAVVGRHHLNLFMRAGELTMGTGLPAFSGLFHENDLGVLGSGQLAVMELKHRGRGGVSKDDLLVFNQKTLDFQLALIRAGTRGGVLRVFVTNDAGVPDRFRGYCVQWGIVLIEPTLLPIPVLTAAMRDLDDTGATADPEFDRHLLAAEQLAGALRPLDRLLAPSSLSSWRRLLDAGAMPSGVSLENLVASQRELHAYVTSLYASDRRNV